MNKPEESISQWVLECDKRGTDCFNVLIKTLKEEKIYRYYSDYTSKIISPLTSFVLNLPKFTITKKDHNGYCAINLIRKILIIDGKQFIVFNEEFLKVRSLVGLDEIIEGLSRNLPLKAIIDLDEIIETSSSIDSLPNF